MKTLEYNDLYTSKVRRQYEKVIACLERDGFSSAQVKKFKEHDLYCARLDDANRLIFKIAKYQGVRYALILEVVLNHAYDKSKFLRGVKIDEAKIPLIEALEQVSLKVEQSTNEEWQTEARRLELEGKQEQADGIRRSILKTQPVPWDLVTPQKAIELADQIRTARDNPQRPRKTLREGNIPLFKELLSAGANTELSNTNPYCKKLFKRIRTGHYVLNPTIQIRKDDWVDIYRFAGIELMCRITSDTENAFSDFIKSLTSSMPSDYASIDTEIKADKESSLKLKVKTKRYAYEIEGKIVTVEAETKSEAL